MEVYFDNAATTKVLSPAADMVLKVMTEDYGNPSAKHGKGICAERHVKTAADIISGTLKASPKEIVFTSGGSESNNMALIGASIANKRSGNHIITTAIEHASVYNPLAYLEGEGFEVTYLPVDHNGHISLADLEHAIRKETILVSVMYVNNEIGTVEPVEEIAKIIHKRNPAILFHVDAIQAYGKYAICPKRQGIDLLSVSGHKIHAPKGVGFLFVGGRVKMRPLIYGGGQQRNLRSGTENVPGIAGLGVAVREMHQEHAAITDRLYGLKDYMIKRLGEVEGTTVNSLTGRQSAPQIVSASFSGVKSEVLLHALDGKGIFVSSGSACSSNQHEISRTLKEIGIKKELLDSTLRFSFGLYNTKKEVDYCICALQELLPVLRRYQRG